MFLFPADFFLVISTCKITESFASIVIEGESVLKNIQQCKWVKQTG